MMKKYKETEPTWFGYVDIRQTRSKMYVKNRKGQKTIRCQSCGITVPSQVPRIAIETSWSGGHLCLKCVKSSSVQWKKEQYEKGIRDLQRGLNNIKKVERLSEEIMDDEEYKQVMDIMVMTHKLGLKGGEK
jgi:hypothetical protein